MEAVAWETVESCLRAGLPFVVPVGGTNGVQLLYDGHADRMMIRVPSGDNETSPRLPFTHLKIHQEEVLGQRYLCVVTEGLGDLRPFHQLAVLCATVLEAGGVRASQAIAKALQSWVDLLKRRPLLSDDAQLGLRGELALLDALVKTRGSVAVEAWTAYNRTISGRHDFRLDATEVEVKSTRQRERRHRISSLQQLKSSPGFSLYVLSLQFEQSGLGHGLTLKDAVHRLRSALSADSDRKQKFENFLALALYRDLDEDFYDETLTLASQPCLVAVDSAIPLFSRENLVDIFPPESLQRLISVNYEVDFGGLGVVAGDPIFNQILGCDQFI
jgi:hypothetical protein